MAVVKIDGIPVPRVFDRSLEPITIGQEAETADGTTHLDAIATKRMWRIETRWIDEEDAFAVVDHLADIMYGAVNFWNADFGSENNTIEAFVRMNPVRVHPVISTLRALSFTVRER